MALDIRPATADDLDDVVPLLAGYQRFYAGDARDDEHNRAFLARFVAPSDDGLLLLARDDDTGEPLGFANLYWTFSSVAAEEHALLNDLFVAEAGRGTGVGHALIEAAAGHARRRGHHRMSWQTAVDNRRAQRLYERFDAERTIWFEYELRL
ncbi:MAG TPA: GNAT family N-acetyltransferase [Solirubrobacteraceae bacterium]|nr:GNAT family N-acetyltransferase [Solirubrobacteraceae bacterium]